MAQKRPDEVVEIQYDYVEAPEYRVIPGITGAWGGVSPSGELQIAFYWDRRVLPKSYTDQGGGEGKFVTRHPEGKEPSIERIVETMIVIRPDVALGLGEWLTQHAKVVLEAQGFISDVPDSSKTE